jgi:hypothetical protein
MISIHFFRFVFELPFTFFHLSILARLLQMLLCAMQSKRLFGALAMHLQTEQQCGIDVVCST